MRMNDTEEPVLRGCLDLLKLRGIPAYRSNSACIRVGRRMVRMLPSGCPDITAILPRMKDGRTGVYCGIETKAPVSPRRPEGGRVRESQMRFGTMAEAAGAVWLFVYTIDGLNRWLDENLADTGETRGRVVKTPKGVGNVSRAEIRRAVKSVMFKRGRP